MQVLRQVWVQQFIVEDGALRWRDKKELPPALTLINSPCDAEARYSLKRDIVWTGYKVHLTENCEEEAPHIITHVEIGRAHLNSMQRVTITRNANREPRSISQ